MVISGGEFFIKRVTKEKIYTPNIGGPVVGWLAAVRAPTATTAMSSAAMRARLVRSFNLQPLMKRRRMGPSYRHHRLLPLWAEEECTNNIT